MNKTKVDFITDLLSSKRIKDIHKERFLSLAVQEIKTLGEVDENVLAKLKHLEEEINQLKHEPSKDESRVDKPKGLPPNPEATKNFLTYFRDSEGLKYLTHDFKDPTNPPSRTALLEIAKREFEEALKKYPNIPDGLKRRIEEFSFKAEPEWFIRKGPKRLKVTEGWSSKTFSTWFDGQRPPDIKHPCRNSKWNKLMIEPFKRSIQVRDEVLNEILQENIELVFSESEQRLFNIKYDHQSMKIADFYTDVDSLGLALYRIFSSIKKHALSQGNYDIVIDFIPDFEGSYKCIRICHVNSKPTKALTRDFAGGDLTELLRALFGLCNWAIEAHFDNGKFRRYLLFDRKIKKTEFKLEPEVEGFTHLLMFY